jgi:hypothetical protein
VDPFLPYFAGFFDGEGSIGIYRNTRYHQPGRTLRVQVTQNVGREATELLQEARGRWGGALSMMNRAHARPAWMWQVSASKGVRALRDIRPWLRVKAEQADVALNYWDARTFMRRGVNGQFLPLSEAMRTEGATAEAALKALKRGEFLEISTLRRGCLQRPAPPVQMALW